MSENEKTYNPFDTAYVLENMRSRNEHAAELIRQLPADAAAGVPERELFLRALEALCEMTGETMLLNVTKRYLAENDEREKTQP